jgi:hypothetical protein
MLGNTQVPPLSPLKWETAKMEEEEEEEMYSSISPPSRPPHTFAYHP